jgi:hypothetical protein
VNLLESVLNAGGGDAVRQLAQKFNLNEDQAAAGISSLLPAIAGGAQNQIASGGLSNLLSTLTSGQHAKYADDPNAVNQPSAVTDGTGVLKQLLGGAEAHQQVAQQAAQQTGISSDTLTQMLPLVASMAMGAMSKHVASNNLQNASAGDQSSGLLGMPGSLGAQASGGNASSLESGVLGLASRLFSR